MPTTRFDFSPKKYLPNPNLCCLAICIPISSYYWIYKCVTRTTTFHSSFLKKFSTVHACEFTGVPTSNRLRRIRPGHDNFVQSSIRTPACSAPLFYQCSATFMQVRVFMTSLVCFSAPTLSSILAYWNMHQVAFGPLLPVTSTPGFHPVWIPVFSILIQSCANIS